MHKDNGFLINIFVLISSFFATLGIAEVYLRIFNPRFFTENDLADNAYSSLFRLEKGGKPIYSSYSRQKIIYIKNITGHIRY